MSDSGISSQAADYTAFARSPLWDLQRQYYSEKGLDAWAEAQVPHYVTSHPVMAMAYAQIVLGFWRDLKAQGLASDQPLYIIELGAGCGRLAWHFLLQFFEAFDAIRGPDDRVCYVMTDFCAKTLEHWRIRLHGKLGPFIEQGRLDFALFDVETDSQVALQNQGITLTPGSLELPPVVIANYVFGSIRQDLFFLDKERLYEGWMKVEPGAESDPDQPFAGMTPDYQKRRITGPGYPDQQWNRLIEDYARRLPPCALLFPACGLNALERLAQLHDGNLLLLSADRGSQAVTDLASQQTPGIACHGSFTLPVNYPVLMDLIEANGGTCWTSTPSNDLSILAACRRAAAAGSWRETTSAARQALQAFNPNDFYRIKQTLEVEGQPLDPAQMLAFLRLARWDTKVFYLFFPHISTVLAQLSGSTQEQWFRALSEVWRFHLPIGEDYNLAFDLGSLATELNRWRAAAQWFSQSLESPAPAQDDEQRLSNTWFNLGICHWQSDNYSLAETCLLKALELEGGDQARNAEDAAAIRRTIADLNDWQDRCARLLGAQTLRLTDSPSSVYATLLGPHQARALYRLQRDPQLCRLAGVERLSSIDHARDWVRKQQSDHNLVLGIQHPDLGLVGVAALAYAPGATAPGGSQSARFHYWIGHDYQNHGHGLQAMKLLHHLAELRGIHHLFGLVDRDNASSLRVLDKLGYQRLSAQPAGTPQGRHYHYWGQAASEPERHGIFSRFLGEQEPG